MYHTAALTARYESSDLPSFDRRIVGHQAPANVERYVLVSERLREPPLAIQIHRNERPLSNVERGILRSALKDSVIVRKVLRRG